MNHPNTELVRYSSPHCTLYNTITILNIHPRFILEFLLLIINETENRDQWKSPSPISSLLNWVTNFAHSLHVFCNFKRGFFLGGGIILFWRIKMFLKALNRSWSISSTLTCFLFLSLNLWKIYRIVFNKHNLFCLLSA